MTTALYRRYRPDTFEDVIGQEHVTGALETALSTSRVAHAFLFSGPRGCGKTTSARILARSLNCEKGPTPTPCGTCASCIDLASGGPGSLDVIEIDAASHNGVDDARSLRERAEFAPTRDRYRIFILDEAHMVTPQGFNALLKLVEEPPEHVKFIFATTEPDKVITTIRSRTHHYPFRLVPPGVLMPYLRSICVREGVTIDESVLPLITRAGGGSVRDSLSVLDQLIAGSEGNVTYEQAARLLGFTDSALLDRAIDALGGNDGAATFAVVEEIVEAGHEPRRFVEDLLQRLRDLIVCGLAGPARAQDILVGIPPDQLTKMLQQAAQWGTRLLSRRADMVEEALREMTGATAPRLQLELLLARLLVEQPAEPTARVAPIGDLEPSQPSGAARGPGQPGPPPDAADLTTDSQRKNLAAAGGPGPAAGDSGGQPVPASGGLGPGAVVAGSEPRLSEPDEPVVQGSDGSAEPTSTPTRPAGAADAGAPDDRPSTSTSPSQDDVRRNWRQLLEQMSQRSSLYTGLLGATRGVDSSRGTVRFTLAEDGYVRRFKSMGGEQDLGQVLSQIFGQDLSAEVGTAEQFAGGQSQQAHPAASNRSVPPSSAESEPPTGEGDGWGPGESAGVAPSEQKPPVVDGPGAAPGTEHSSADQAQSVGRSDATQSAEDSDPDAKYRSMQATDRVLDILGGRVVDEIVEESATASLGGQSE